MIGVVIATVGRAELISDMLQGLDNQSRRPDWVVIACTGKTDVPAEVVSTSAKSRTSVLFGEKGLAKQRNNGIIWLKQNTSLCVDVDNVVVFLDDDFVMRRDWLAAAEHEMSTNRRIAGLTGVVLADGAKTPGYSAIEAIEIINADRRLLPKHDWRLKPGPAHSLYGCNMAVRATALSRLGFDEQLPGYGWLEDYEFSSKLAKLGELLRIPSLVGVHLGAKRGRAAGRQTGYSQIANPIYLYRKGAMSLHFAVKLMSKNILANVGRSMRPEPYIDRRGRVAGNMTALADVLSGRLAPDRLYQSRDVR